MGNYLSVPVLVLMAALQASILPIVLGEITPSLVLLVVMSWAINANLQQGIIWAFVGGIVLDLLSALPLGTSVIGMVIIVFFVSGIGLQVFRFGLLLLLGLTAAVTVFQEMLVIIFIDIYQWMGLLPTDMVGFSPNWTTDFTTVVLPTLIYNLFVILPVYIIIRRIQRGIGIA